MDLCVVGPSDVKFKVSDERLCGLEFSLGLKVSSVRCSYVYYGTGVVGRSMTWHV